MEFKKRFIGQGKVGGRHGRDDQFTVRTEMRESEIERTAGHNMTLSTLGYNLSICQKYYIIMQ